MAVEKNLVHEGLVLDLIEKMHSVVVVVKRMSFEDVSEERRAALETIAAVGRCLVLGCAAGEMALVLAKLEDEIFADEEMNLPSFVPAVDVVVAVVAVA